MRSVLSIEPRTNFAMSSIVDREDSMVNFSRVLMGLSYPLSIIGHARELTGVPYQWPIPPKLERRWMAVFSGDTEEQLEWRTTTLIASLHTAGLRATLMAESYEPGTVATWSRHGVQDEQGMWSASLALRRWPREVAPGWLGHALATDLPVDVGIHVEPQDAQKIARFLKHQGEWQMDANLNKPDAANDLGRGDAESVRRKLIARTDRPCRVAVALTTRAPDRKTLKARVETLGHEIGLALGDARPVTFEHDRGRRATEPTGECDLLGVKRTLDCTSVAATWPFQPATINHEHGAPIGVTHDGKMLVTLDPFDDDLESFGGIVLAKVGMGKSYLLKLIALRLKNVETMIVEQRIPAEYENVPRARSVNLAEVAYDQRAIVLREFIENLWETAKRDPRPRLLILDELWSLLRDDALAALVEEIARIGRHRYLSLWIATQQVSDLLSSRGGLATLENASMRIFLKQHDHDLDKLAAATGMSTPARRFLRTADRGQALFDLKGMVVPVDIQASPLEHAAITTDPRERARMAA